MLLLQLKRYRPRDLRDLRYAALSAAHADREWEDLLQMASAWLSGGDVNEIVMVTTYKREPLLALCLESIRAQDADVSICVFSDRGEFSQRLLSVCKQFSASLTVQCVTKGYGNSWNVIEAMCYCVASDATIIFSIEDDTILHRGYFEFARNALNAPNVACALGRMPGDPLSTWYESPCVSWRKDRLIECLRLLPAGYFADTREEMQKIVDAAFPKSKYRYGSAEQDGFFLRCLEFLGLRTAFPEHSYASHLGIAGYNRPGGPWPEGTFDEQVEWFRKLLNDRRKRVELFGEGITDREMRGMNA